MANFDAFNAFVRRNVPIAELGWAKIGGPIEYLATPRTEEELVAILKERAKLRTSVRALGDGSNILASDSGAPGLAIKLSEPLFGEIRVEGRRVEVGAGVKIGRLATAAASAGLAGVEGLVGIPGTVGAGVVANVSTPDASLGQWVVGARVATYSGEIYDLTKDDFVFGYRTSNIENAIVLSASLELEPDSPEALARRLQKIWIGRKNSRPELKGGLLRMFKNPRGQRAAELIAEAGFSGARIGGARVCESDPNLIQTSADASSEDVKRLLTLIQTQARERVGVELEREVEFW